MTDDAEHRPQLWMADDAWRNRFFPYTCWRAGSRRSFVESLHECCSSLRVWRRQCASMPIAEAALYIDTVEFLAGEVAWFAKEAVRAGYIDDANAALLSDPNEKVARTVLAIIWDFATDPAFATRRASDEARRQRLTDIATPEQRAILQGTDWKARAAVVRELAADPAMAAIEDPSGNDFYHFDWPAGTPPWEIGLWQWLGKARYDARMWDRAQDRLSEDDTASEGASECGTSA